MGDASLPACPQTVPYAAAGPIAVNFLFAVDTSQPLEGQFQFLYSHTNVPVVELGLPDQVGRCRGRASREGVPADRECQRWRLQAQRSDEMGGGRGGGCRVVVPVLPVQRLWGPAGPAGPGELSSCSSLV